MRVPGVGHDQEPTFSSTTSPSDARRARRLPTVSIGLIGGVVGIMCCVGPTALALFGIVGAATAFAWATDLYDGYAWWFRLGGVAVMGATVWVWLHRRGECHVSALRRLRWRLAGILGVAVVTYAALYAVTTWLGTLA